ncbi:MAG: hypothetical protein AAGH89_05910, partial [Verrucomicrobiota bacterium]
TTYPTYLFEELTKVEGLDLGLEIASLWRQESELRNLLGDENRLFSPRLRQIASMAIDFGHVEALEVSILQLGLGERRSRRGVAWDELVARRIPVSADEALSWYLKSRARVQWDSERQLYDTMPSSP